MKNGLTKREKVLLFIAAVLFIGILGFKFLLTPAYVAYDNAKTKHDNLANTKQIVEQKIENESNTRQSYTDALTNFEDVETLYPPIMTNEELDILITSMCLEHKLKPTMLGMSVREQETPDTKPVPEDSGDDAPQDASLFAVTTATINATGSFSDLQNLIKTVEKISYIKISAMSYSEPKSQAIANTQKKPSSVTLTFDVTMLDDTKIIK